MKRSTFHLLLITLSILANPVLAQTALLYEVPLEERINAADVVAEGRVTGQDSYWNDDRTLIFTSSTVEVSRVFKGQVVTDEIQVVTPGGRVGLTAQHVTPALRLAEGDAGVFFLEEYDAPSTFGKSAGNWYAPVASVQGMARYDEIRGLANDIFSTYERIEEDLHRAIAKMTGAPAIVNAYAVPKALDQRLSKSGAVPTINSISPGTLTAGTNTVLTISGSGFEAFDGGTNSKVFFANADDGGSSLIGAPANLVSSWSDTEIQVRVPTRAGTGSVTVQTASSLQASSASPLTVEYNLLGIPFSGDLWRTSLASKVSGGYSMRMSTSTADGGVSFAGSDAVAPFERALFTWQQMTGLNIRADGADIDSSRIAPNSDNDIITFETDATPLPSGVLGRAFSGFTSCDGQTWIVQGIDLQFRRDGNSVTWNFGPDANSGNRADFESVALHEVGHAHQMGHIIAPGRVMHYALTNGTDVRVLDSASDIAGGDDAIDFAQGLNTFCGSRMWTGMVRLVNVGVDDEIARDGFGLSVAHPNPTVDGASFTLRVGRSESVSIHLYDLLGRRVSMIHEGILAPGIDHRFEVGTGGLPAGLYFYTAVGPTLRATRPVVVAD